MITPELTLQSRRVKNDWSSDGFHLHIHRYSSDLAPTDYHFSRSLSNYLGEKKFDDENDLKMDLTNFFAQKYEGLYERGILSLPGRWQQVRDSNGADIVES